MEKELTDMSLEALWTLFPIFLVEHDDRWEDAYNEMEAEIKEILRAYCVDRISHIGSTAVRGIWAKNIIDVLIEIPQCTDMEEIARALEQRGFLRMSASPTRISLNKGYTKNGFAPKVYHIHIRYTGDNDELYFRDYLIGHPEVAKEYEQLKLKLWKEYEHDRDAYTAAKTTFIRKHTKAAIKEFAGKYRCAKPSTIAYRLK